MLTLLGGATLEEEMSRQAFERAGLDKLTEEELAFLNEYLGREPVSREDAFGREQVRTAQAEPRPAPVGAERDAAAGADEATPQPEARRSIRSRIGGIFRRGERAGGSGEPAGAGGEPAGASVEPAGTSEEPVGASGEPAGEQSSKKGKLPAIHSRIRGEFNGWDGHTLFALENGQVWQQRVSGLYRYRANSPAVTVIKGRFGYYLIVDKTKRQVGVKRVQ